MNAKVKNIVIIFLIVAGLAIGAAFYFLKIEIPLPLSFDLKMPQLASWEIATSTMTVTETRTIVTRISPAEEVTPAAAKKTTGAKVIKMRPVKLYYYDPSRDYKDSSGGVVCSNAGLSPVIRDVVSTQTIIRDTIDLLIKGQLTESEKVSGITTEFPLPGLALKEASIGNGVLTLRFDDPQNKTSGGACRVNILRAQIEATAKQFVEIGQVRFVPETLFQP